MACLTSPLTFFLIDNVLGLNTGKHRLLRTGNLRTIPVLGLGEDRQQDDPPARSNPIGHADRLPRQVEPKLTKLALQLLRLRLGEQDAAVGQQIHVERRMAEVGTRKPVEPVPDLRLKLHRTPRHTTNDITPARRLPARTGSQSVSGSPDPDGSPSILQSIRL